MNIAKTGAAFGLAALTLASSLSLGAAANAAPVAPSGKQATDGPANSKVLDSQKFRFYGYTNDGSFGWGPGSGYLVSAQSLDAAESQARDWTVRLGSESGWFNLYDQDNSCIKGAKWPKTESLFAGGGCSSQGSWRISTDGLLESREQPGAVLAGNYFNQGVQFLGLSTSTNAAWHIVGLNGLHAKATSIDVYNRTAVIEGHANPGATVVIGNKQIDADATTGEWTTTVKNLEIGENTVEMEQFDGTESLGKSSFIVDVKTTPLSFKVTSTSIKDNSADVEVTGTPGATVEYQNKDVSLGRTGTATATVTGLEIGSNKVDFEQFVDRKSIGGPKPFDIMMTVADLTVEHKFGANNNENVILSGKAESGAHVTIVDENGDPTETDAGPKGTWSTPVKAPGSGLQTFEVHQTIGDANSLIREHDVNYGNSVEILEPRDNSDTTSSTVRFTGDGQSLANISILENDKALANFQALNSGNWNRDLTGVNGDYKHTYTVRMLSKGNLTTEETITLNPDKDYEAAATAFELTNPKDGGEVTQVDGKVAFEGKGQKGSLVEAIFGGHVIATDTISDANTWKADNAVLPVGNQIVRFKVTATDKAVTNHYATVTVKAAADQGTPFELTNPKDGGEVTQVNGKVAFEGKGQKGSLVEAIFDGHVIAKDTISDANTWKADNAVLPVGNQNVRFKVTTPGKPVQNFVALITVKAEAGTAFAFTNPEDGGDVTQVRGKVEFHGKAKDKTEIELWDLNASDPNKMIVGKGTATSTDTWSITDVILSPGAHNIRAKYVEPGKAPQNTYAAITVKAAPGTELPFELLTPGDNGLIESFVNGDGVNVATFKGLGTTGGHVEIWTSGNSAPDRIVAIADVKNNGSWEGTGGISNWTWKLEARYTLDNQTTVTPFTATIVAPTPTK